MIIDHVCPTCGAAAPNRDQAETPKGFLTRRCLSDRQDAKISELASYGAALLVFVLGFYKLSRLEMNESGLFLGALLILCVCLLLVVLGQQQRAPRTS